MSTAQVIAPAPIASSPVVKSRNGRASVSTIVNVGVLKRHSVAYIPSLSWATKSMGLPSSGTVPTSSSPRSPTASTSSIATTVTSLFTGHNNSHSNNYNSTRRSMDKAAERDWNEQAKQVFQLSTVNAQGNFVPPHLNPSLDKGYVDIETLQQQDADRDFDYFATTIVNTPPERVRTFLSTESTISPGMFSSPTKSRIKRHTISFPASPSPAVAVPVTQSKLLPPPPVRTTPSPEAHTQPQGLNRRPRSSTLYDSRKPQVVRTTAPSVPSPAPVDTLSMPPSSPTVVSATESNVYIGSSPPATPRPRRVQHSSDSRRSSTASLQAPKQQEQQEHQKEDTKSHARRKARAQLSFLTGVALEEEDEESDALLDPFSSMMSSSPVDLVFGSRSSLDASSLSSSLSSSPDMSPRRRSTILSSSSLSSFSPATVQKDKERIWRINEQRLRAQNGF